MLSHDDNNDRKSYGISFMFHGKSSIRLTVVATTTILVHNTWNGSLNKKWMVFLSHENVISVVTLIWNLCFTAGSLKSTNIFNKLHTKTLNYTMRQIKRNYNTQHLTSKSSIILCFSSSWLRRTAISAAPGFCLESNSLITLFAFSMYFLWRPSSTWNSASFRPKVSCNASSFCSADEIIFLIMIQLM